MHTYLLAA